MNAMGANPEGETNLLLTIMFFSSLDWSGNRIYHDHPLSLPPLSFPQADKKTASFYKTNKK